MDNCGLYGGKLTSFKLPSLEAFFFSGWHQEHDLVQALLSHSKDRLRVVSWGKIYRPSFHDVLQQGLLQNVEILCLNFFVEESEFGLIAAWMPALYELHLSCGDVSERILRFLVEKKGVPLRKITSVYGSMKGGAATFARVNGVTFEMQIGNLPEHALDRSTAIDRFGGHRDGNATAEAFRATASKLGLGPKT